MSPQRAARVAIVGAGPAGLATAIALAQRGLATAIFDCGEAPLDKPCGEGLLPPAVAALGELGIDPLALGGHEIRGVAYFDRGLVTRASFPDRAGCGLQRKVLHAGLIERARRLGVEVCWRHEVGEIVDGAATVHDRALGTAAELRADLWVVASGLGRPSPRQLRGRTTGDRFGARLHYACRPWEPEVEVHWGNDVEAYVTPVAADRVGVAYLWSGRRRRPPSLEEFPLLARRLVGCRGVDPLRGRGPLRRAAGTYVSERTAWVGDAAGYTDAITGEGLGIAFRQALALAEAVAAGRLLDYRREARRIVRVPALLARSTLLLARSGALRRRVFAVFRDSPDVFARFLAVQADPAPGLTALAGALSMLVGAMMSRRRPAPPTRGGETVAAPPPLGDGR